MKQTELKKMVEKAIARQEQTEKMFEGSTNPQIIELVKTAQVTKNTLVAVLDALNGSPVLMKIISGI